MNTKRKKSDLVFTPKIDKQIIEGLLENREYLFAELERDNFNKSVILQRASELGMSEDMGQKYQKGKIDAAARLCLRCNRYFASIGKNNRLCRRCCND